MVGKSKIALRHELAPIISLKVLFHTVLLLLLVFFSVFLKIYENLALKQQQQQQILLKIGNITNYITFPPAKTFFWMGLDPYPKGLCLFFSARTICGV